MSETTRTVIENQIKRRSRRDNIFNKTYNMNGVQKNEKSEVEVIIGSFENENR